MHTNCPSAPCDEGWADYWQSLLRCDVFWEEGPYRFSVFPPGSSWVGVIRKLRPLLREDWSTFDKEQQKRLLGCARKRDENWALLGNTYHTAPKAVFGNPGIHDQIESAVKSVIHAEDDSFLEVAATAYASLTALPGIGAARATRLLALARPDRCVSVNGASEWALAGYAVPASDDPPGENSYGKLLRGIHRQCWFSECPTEFGSDLEEEAWGMRVALLDAFIYKPRRKPR